MKDKIRKTKIILRQRDYTIFRLLYEYRFLDTELLWYLLKEDDHTPCTQYSIGVDGKRRPKKYSFGRQALSKRLKQLFDSGYVKRHYLTDQPIGRGYGSPRAIYGMGRRSPKLLKEIYHISTRRVIENNRVKSPYLRHSMELASFRIILELACRQSKGKVSILFWEQGSSIKDHVYRYNGKRIKEKFTFYADAFFGLRINGNRSKHYFLEIDRGTEPIVSNLRRSNIRIKFLGYQAYFKAKRICQRYSNRIKGFQVLVVTPGQIESAVCISGRIENILNELLLNPGLYSTPILFLLTTPESISLQKPELLFAKIWLSTKSNSELVSIID